MRKKTEILWRTIAEPGRLDEKRELMRKVRAADRFAGGVEQLAGIVWGLVETLGTTDQFLEVADEDDYRFETLEEFIEFATELLEMTREIDGSGHESAGERGPTDEDNGPRSH